LTGLGEICDFVVDGNIFYDGKIVKACVGIIDGKIQAIKKIIKGEKYKDFGYRLILPAGIDAHVHFREPGLVKKEDFYNGSLCAALGGISCVLDMPNTKPPVVSISNLEDKVSIAKRRSHVDFGFFALPTSSMNLGSIEALSKLAIGFKIFMAGASKDLMVKDENELHRLIEMIAKTGKIISIHAEDEDMIEENKKGLIPKNLQDHNKIRSEDAELSAIKKILNINSKYNAKIHFAHLSSAKSVELLRSIKKEVSLSNSLSNITKISNISSEVTPHHLFLTENFSMPSRPSKPGFGKVNPPLRKPTDRESLYNALLDGTIDILASDHAPHTIEEKEDEFERVPSGMPGVETSLPMFLSILKHNYIELPKLVQIFSTRPAEIFGLNKGKIEVGYDADLIVIDMHDEEKIKSSRVHYKCGWTPFENFFAIYPEYTFVRGNMVVENKEIVGDPGLGCLQTGKPTEKSDKKE